MSSPQRLSGVVQAIGKMFVYREYGDQRADQCRGLEANGFIEVCDRPAQHFGDAL